VWRRDIAPGQKGFRRPPDRGVGRGGIGLNDARQLLTRDRGANDEVAAFDS
jgi:hypothetical protein